MKRTALVMLLALAGWSAQAAQNVPGWHVGGGASFADFDGKDEINPSLGESFINDGSVGLKVWGQYRFNDWLAVEGAYHNTGDFEDLSKSDAVNGNADLDLSFDGFSVQGLLYFPLQSEEIQPYIKAGLYDFDDELSVDGNVTSNSSESGFVVGTGAVIDIADHFSIRADLDWFDADVGDLWAVNLGLQYSFGGSKSAAPVEDAAPAAETGAVEPEPAPMDAAPAADEAVEEAADEPAEEASEE